MKKLLVAAVAVALISLTSCGTGGSVFSAGTWSYKGVSYNAYAATGSTTAKTLTASYANSSESDNVICYFQTFPPAAGTYTVVNTPVSSASQVYMVMNIGLKGFTVDVSGASTATVTVNSAGKVAVIVNSVTFSNITGQTADSGPFTASFTQNL
ncbi:MAG: hypothetical protein JWO03_1268 [Bacteroidetes bacterium]|nr:hypothetical protein [Bacteroidota bacterium]